MSRYPAAPPVDVGDVLVTREGPWWVGEAIRLGHWLRTRHYSPVNHVIMVHHRDEVTGRWVGIEGRPGGVGWVDVSDRLTWAATNVNNAQPKSQAQRYLVAKAAERLLALPYDWRAIGADALRDLGLGVVPFGALLAPDWHTGVPPAQVMCSAFHDWAYEEVALGNPGGPRGTRWTEPGDWDTWMTRRGWTHTRS